MQSLPTATMAPGTGPDAQATTPDDQCRMRITIDISHGEITETVTMHMGPHNETRLRRWLRVGGFSFKSRDPDWDRHYHRFGAELVNFMTALKLPTDIANMLPRRKASPESVARVAKFVGSLQADDGAQP